MSHSVQAKTRSLQTSRTTKLSKPLMEKRRRARINHNLSRLKTLILQALHKHTSPHAKLEKADILEVTVKHIRHTQQQRDALASYGAGFSACACDVAHFLARCECVSSVMRMCLLAHLARCLSEMHIITPSPGAVSTSSSELGNYKHRSVLLPGVRSSSVSRDILMNSGLSPPLVSRVVRVRVRGQLWRPW